MQKPLPNDFIVIFPYTESRGGPRVERFTKSKSYPLVWERYYHGVHGLTNSLERLGEDAVIEACKKATDFFIISKTVTVEEVKPSVSITIWPLQPNPVDEALRFWNVRIPKPHLPVNKSNDDIIYL